MENTEMLNVRVSKELKQRLETQAKDAGMNLSDYLRELLKGLVIQDGVCNLAPSANCSQLKEISERLGVSQDAVIQIFVELINRIPLKAMEEEGRRRRQTTLAHVMLNCLLHGWEALDKTTSWNIWGFRY